jgi:exosortase H (IPTLxxWG-CTERM-specific)
LTLATELTLDYLSHVGRFSKKRLRAQDNRKKGKSETKPVFRKKLLNLSPALKFVLSFLVSLAVLGLAYSHLTAKYHDNILWLMDFTATACGFVLSIFSNAVNYSGKYVSYNGFSVEIIDECTGLLEMVIYLAAVVSFSASIRKKLIGIVTGVPAIYLFNILRIIVLLIAGSMSKRVFDFMHLYFWQATLILMIATVWIGWLVLVVYREKKPVAVSS